MSEAPSKMSLDILLGRMAIHRRFDGINDLGESGVMDLNEEYLDNLLKSMEQKPEEPVLPEESVENAFGEEAFGFGEQAFQEEMSKGQDSLQNDMETNREADMEALDLEALLKNMEENENLDEDLADIKELLDKDANNELVLPEEEPLEEVLPKATAPEKKKRKKKEKKWPFLKKEKAESIPENVQSDEEAAGESDAVMAKETDFAAIQKEAEAGPEAEAEPEVEAKPEVEAEPEMEAESQMEAEPEMEAESQMAEPVLLGGEDGNTLEWESITDLFAALDDIGTDTDANEAQSEQQLKLQPELQPEEAQPFGLDSEEPQLFEMGSMEPKFSEPQPIETEAEAVRELTETSQAEKKKKKKGKKEKVLKEKKPGVLSKIAEFLFAEEDEEEASGIGEAGQQNQVSPSEEISVELLAGTSAENKEVLAQLEKEDREGKKKKKKKGKKAAEKGTGKDASEEDEAEGSEKKDEKKGKKKSKKEKKQKEPVPVDETPEPKLSKKKVRATFVLSLTVLTAILIICIFIPEIFEMQGARKAYYEEDYETCYRTFYGKKLSESDERMFLQSGMLLSIQKRMEGYKSYVAVGDELHALDFLLQMVQKQDEVLLAAEEYQLTQEAENAYQEVLTVLAEKYQLTEEDAKEINAYAEDAIYTLRLKSIVEGTEFVMPDFATPAGEGEPAEEEVLEDVLPVEEELTDIAFEEGS